MEAHLILAPYFQKVLECAERAYIIGICPVLPMIILIHMCIHISVWVKV